MLKKKTFIFFDYLYHLKQKVLKCFNYSLNLQKKKKTKKFRIVPTSFSKKTFEN